MRCTVLHIVTFLIFYMGNAQTYVQEVGQMPLELNENSGHLFLNGNLVSHNDSGNEPILYVLDTVSLQINRRVSVSNAFNIDWEDLTQDEAYIYVGDIGNYTGTRTDLTIYKIAKDDFNQNNEVTAETIHFSYENQQDFNDNGESNWDAEALTVYQDGLLVFTKEWITQGTTVYAIPKEPGNHIATKITSYPSNGLVTGATYDEAENGLLLIGYSSLLSPFVIRSRDIVDGALFDNDVERISLDIGFAQAEAITSVGASRYFIGTERFERQSLGITLAPMLYALQFESETSETDEIPEAEEEGGNYDEDRLVLYGSHTPKKLQYELLSDKTVLAQAIFDTSGKRLRFTPGPDIENTYLDLTTFESGVYYLTLYLGDKILSKAFVAY